MKSPPPVLADGRGLLRSARFGGLFPGAQLPMRIPIPVAPTGSGLVLLIMFGVLPFYPLMGEQRVGDWAPVSDPLPAGCSCLLPARDRPSFATIAHEHTHVGGVRRWRFPPNETSSRPRRRLFVRLPNPAVWCRYAVHA